MVYIDSDLLAVVVGIVNVVVNVKSRRNFVSSGHVPSIVVVVDIVGRACRRWGCFKPTSESRNNFGQTKDWILALKQDVGVIEFAEIKSLGLEMRFEVRFAV